MRKTAEQMARREAMIHEYLKGGISYVKLAAKYQVDPSDLNKWVRTYQGETVGKKKTLKPGQSAKQPEPLLAADVKQLQEELRKARLHNELLNAMIDIAEDQLKIDIRKKSGTRR